MTTFLLAILTVFVRVASCEQVSGFFPNWNRASVRVIVLTACGFNEHCNAVARGVVEYQNQGENFSSN